jgi:hypothetical protein
LTAARSVTQSASKIRKKRWADTWVLNPESIEISVTKEEHVSNGAKGEEQDPMVYHMQYIPDCLLISDFTGGVSFLNPAVKDKDGEWEAWHHASWYPGAVRYNSFETMIAAINDIES